MTTIFLGAVFKPFFKIVHDTGQQLTIDRTNFMTDGVLQIIQRTGFVSVNMRFQISPKKKNHTEDRKSGRATAHLRNGKWGAWETCFEQWSVTHLQCALWHHLVETTHWHSLFFFGAVLSTTHSKDVRFPWVTLYIDFLFLGRAQKTVNVGLGLVPAINARWFLLPKVLALCWLRYLDRCKMYLSLTAIFDVNALLSSGLERMSQRSM